MVRNAMRNIWEMKNMVLTIPELIRKIETKDGSSSLRSGTL